MSHSRDKHLRRSITQFYSQGCFKRHIRRSNGVKQRLNTQHIKWQCNPKYIKLCALNTILIVISSTRYILRFKITKKPLNSEWFFCLETGIDLSSRAVSSQVLLAQVSLTSVFGMGTGGTSPLQTPVMVEY